MGDSHVHYICHVDQEVVSFFSLNPSQIPKCSITMACNAHFSWIFTTVVMTCLFSDVLSFEPQKCEGLFNFAPQTCSCWPIWGFCWPCTTTNETPPNRTVLRRLSTRHARCTNGSSKSRSMQHTAVESKDLHLNSSRATNAADREFAPRQEEENGEVLRNVSRHGREEGFPHEVPRSVRQVLWNSESWRVLPIEPR